MALVIYTLNPTTFEREVLLDDYISAIWTERYIGAGDVKLSVPATRKHINLLAPGTILELKDSEEPMLLHTREINDGMVTVTGNTLETHLNQVTKGHEWLINAAGTAYSPFRSDRHKLVDKPGIVMGLLVTRFMSRYGQSPSFMDVGALASIGENIEQIVPEKDLYDRLLEMSNTYKIGMSVKLVRGASNRLVFSTRVGIDLTRANPDKLVRFSPDIQNLANLKELNSISEYKNIVVIRPPTFIKYLEPFRLRVYVLKDAFDSLTIETYERDPVTGLYPADSISNYNNAYWDENKTTTVAYKIIPSGNPFTRREIYLEIDDIFDDMLGNSGHTPGMKIRVFQKMMKKRAIAALQEHNKINIIDGEVTPSTLYKYKRDYDLGDLVEIEGNYESIVTGRVTEYIRSSDNTGQREYPTLVAGDPISETVSVLSKVWNNSWYF